MNDPRKRPCGAPRPVLALLLAAPLLLLGAGGTLAGDAGDDTATGQTPPAEKRVAAAPANGRGDAIAWRGLEEGLDLRPTRSVHSKRIKLKEWH